MCSRRRQPGFTPTSRPILPVFDAFSRRPLRPAVTLPSVIVSNVSATYPGRPADPVVWLALRRYLPIDHSPVYRSRDVGVVCTCCPRLWKVLSVRARTLHTHTVRLVARFLGLSTPLIYATNKYNLNCASFNHFKSLNAVLMP